MRKEFVVKSIDSTPDGQPHVIVSLISAKDMLDDNSGYPPSPFGDNKMMGFSNVNDMVKDLNKMMAGMGGMGHSSGITSIKLDMHEYKDMGLSVGDKVYIDLSKAESLGV